VTGHRTQLARLVRGCSCYVSERFLFDELCTLPIYADSFGSQGLIKL
jgi:hypothetical protein